MNLYCGYCGDPLGDAPLPHRICPRCWQFLLERLHAPEQYRWLRLAVYYAVLNEDPDGWGFPEALRDLQHSLQSYIWPPPQAPIDHAAWTREAWSAQSEDLDWGARFQRISLGHLPLVAQNHLDSFVRRWYLPQVWGSVDLMMSLRAPDCGLPLRLHVSQRAWSFTADAPTRGSIRMPIFPPFEYDPTRDSTKEARDRIVHITTQVYQQMLGQLHELQANCRQAGWGEIPKRSRDPERLRRSALRLYRRARGLSWAQISHAEHPEPERSVSAIRESVQEWAAALDISLSVA